MISSRKEATAAALLVLGPKAFAKRISNKDQHQRYLIGYISDQDKPVLVGTGNSWETALKKASDIYGAMMKQAEAQLEQILKKMPEFTDEEEDGPNSNDSNPSKTKTDESPGT